MKISIARALAEHKLIDKKIEKLLSQAKYCAIKKGRKDVTVEGVAIADFNEKAKSNYDKITALIKHKNDLKAAIVQSNAGTKLKIGSGEMTVAAAIERKNTIALEERVLNAMKMEYVRAKDFVEKENIRMQSNLDKLLESNFGAGKGGSAKQEEIDAISTPYTDNNQAVLIDPIKIDEKIQAMETAIDEFTKNVDFALNESNVRTEIEVDFE